jgi:hypothetical protein
MAEIVEGLISMCEVLDLISSTKMKEKKKRKERERGRETES